MHFLVNLNDQGALYLKSMVTFLALTIIILMQSDYYYLGYYNEVEQAHYKIVLIYH